MSLKDEIENRLRQEFEPIKLVLENESHLHRGHSGWNETGETHFRLILVSKKFRQLNRVQCHRLVYRCLSPFPMSRIHALRMDLSAE